MYLFSVGKDSVASAARCHRWIWNAFLCYEYFDHSQWRNVMRVFLFRVPLTSCASPPEFPIASILFYFLSLKCIDERFVLAGENLCFIQ